MKKITLKDKDGNTVKLVKKNLDLSNITAGKWYYDIYNEKQLFLDENNISEKLDKAEIGEEIIDDNTGEFLYKVVSKTGAMILS